MLKFPTRILFQRSPVFPKYSIYHNMLKKNETVLVTATDIAHDGCGIGKTDDGFVVFVPQLLISETAQVRILKVLKNRAYGKVVQLLTPSPARLSAGCDIAQPCGGCSFHHTTYENECHIKERLVKNAFRPLRDAMPKINPVTPSEKTVSYRNKMLLPVGTDKNGNPTAGFYRRRSHDIIPCKTCLITYPEFFEIVDCVLGHMKKYDIQPYQEETHCGIVRHIFIRRGEHTGEIMIGLIVNLSEKDISLLYPEELIQNLLNRNPSIVSIGLNFNREKTNVILGNQTMTIHGTPYLTDTMNDIRFRLSLPSFYQVNTLQAEKLYQTALELLDDDLETVFDLYCGIGTITLHLSKKAKKVYGIESCAPAIEDARQNCALNGISNVEFICGTAEEEAPALVSRGIIPDAVVLDPPRSGCDKTLLDMLCDIQPKKIVYISCNPATLARDLAYLNQAGYQIGDVTPFDLFPRTVHVETVALLTQMKPDDYVTIELNEEDLRKV